MTNIKQIPINSHAFWKNSLLVFFESRLIVAVVFPTLFLHWLCPASFLSSSSIRACLNGSGFWIASSVMFTSRSFAQSWTRSKLLHTCVALKFGSMGLNGPLRSNVMSAVSAWHIRACRIMSIQWSATPMLALARCMWQRSQIRLTNMVDHRDWLTVVCELIIVIMDVLADFVLSSCALATDECFWVHYSFLPGNEADETQPVSQDGTLAGKGARHSIFGSSAVQPRWQATAQLIMSVCHALSVWSTTGLFRHTIMKLSPSVVKTGTWIAFINVSGINIAVKLHSLEFLNSLCRRWYHC